MSEYYRDADHLYEIYGYFLNRILTDDKIGPKMSKANIIIKFIYTEPDAEITIDLKNPAPEGKYGTFYLGTLRPERGCVVQADGRSFSPVLARV
jgi:hypothetical protein